MSSANDGTPGPGPGDDPQTSGETVAHPPGFTPPPATPPPPGPASAPGSTPPGPDGPPRMYKPPPDPRIPQAQAPPPPAAAPAAAPVPVRAADAKLNRAAIGSVVAAFFWFFLIGAPAAIVLGHIARGQIDRSEGRQRGRRLATAGIILGYLGLAAFAAVAIASAVSGSNP